MNLCVAFLKLPSEELDRLGVDLHHTYVAGTPEASALQVAWTQRQKELKEMMDKQLKAADHMKTLAGHLVNSSVSDEEIALYLDELEQLLADIDNARDFHTIGGWPALTSLLPGVTGTGSARPLSVQTKAVHCIGTAVKNDYDFQLWVLEKAGIQATEEAGEGESSKERTVLDLLLSALHNTSQRIITTADLSPVLKTELDELQRRLLYALSAAIRGNLDVQTAVSPPSPYEGEEQSEQGQRKGEGSSTERPSFANMLKSCVNAPELSVGVQRKCWHMVADLLDEMMYIRHDVVQEYTAMQEQQGELVGESQSHSIMSGKVLEILKTLRPMGMIFATPNNFEWVVLASEVAAKIASTCVIGEEVTPSPDEEGEESCVLRTSPQVRDIFAHVVKIKAVLLKEFDLDVMDHGKVALNEVSSDGDGEIGSAQLTKLRMLEEQFGSKVKLFSNHPLMQDKLY